MFSTVLPTLLVISWLCHGFAQSSGDIRLVDSQGLPTTSSGIIQQYRNSQWRPICIANAAAWDARVAGLACAVLDLGPVTAHGTTSSMSITPNASLYTGMYPAATCDNLPSASSLHMYWSSYSARYGAYSAGSAYFNCEQSSTGAADCPAGDLAVVTCATSAPAPAKVSLQAGDGTAAVAVGGKITGIPVLTTRQSQYSSYVSAYFKSGICSDLFSSTTANALCHSMGYAKATNWGDAATLLGATPSVLPWPGLTSAACPLDPTNFTACLADSEFKYSLPANKACSESLTPNQWAITCDLSSTAAVTSPLPGDVQFFNKRTGSGKVQGAVQVYDGSAWGFVCYSNPSFYRNSKRFYEAVCDQEQLALEADNSGPASQFAAFASLSGSQAGVTVPTISPPTPACSTSGTNPADCIVFSSPSGSSACSSGDFAVLTCKPRDYILTSGSAGSGYTNVTSTGHGISLFYRDTTDNVPTAGYYPVCAQAAVQKDAELLCRLAGYSNGPAAYGSADDMGYTAAEWNGRAGNELIDLSCSSYSTSSPTAFCKFKLASETGATSSYDVKTYCTNGGDALAIRCAEQKMVQSTSDYSFPDGLASDRSEQLSLVMWKSEGSVSSDGGAVCLADTSDASVRSAATVLCRYLGKEGGVKATGLVGSRSVTVPRWSATGLACTGTEASWAYCAHQGGEWATAPAGCSEANTLMVACEDGSLSYAEKTAASPAAGAALGAGTVLLFGGMYYCAIPLSAAAIKLERDEVKRHEKALEEQQEQDQKRKQQQDEEEAAGAGDDAADKAERGNSPGEESAESRQSGRTVAYSNPMNYPGMGSAAAVTPSHAGKPLESPAEPPAGDKAQDEAITAGQVDAPATTRNLLLAKAMLAFWVARTVYVLLAMAGLFDSGDTNTATWYGRVVILLFFVDLYNAWWSRKHDVYWPSSPWNQGHMLTTQRKFLAKFQQSYFPFAIKMRLALSVMYSFMAFWVSVGKALGAPDTMGLLTNVAAALLKLKVGLLGIPLLMFAAYDFAVIAAKVRGKAKDKSVLAVRGSLKFKAYTLVYEKA